MSSPEGSRVRAKDVATLMRPWQWVKNGFILLPLLFSGQILDFSSDFRALAAVGAFCLVSSAVYCWNDYCDREADRNHPKKRMRPIASGAVPERWAIALAVVLAAAGLAISFFLGWSVLAIVLLYVVNNVLYSLILKHLPIIDVLSVAIGFLLRVFAGIFAIDCSLSPWIVLCTFVLALFLAVEKRLAELRASSTPDAQPSAGSRAVLGSYTEASLESMSLISATLAIVSYALYTFTASVSPLMMLTLPFVIYGVFRYLMLAGQSNVTESPDRVLLDDKPILVDVCIWLVACALILFFG